MSEEAKIETPAPEAAPAAAPEAAPAAEETKTCKKCWIETIDLSRYGGCYVDKAFEWLRKLPFCKWLDKGDEAISSIATCAIAFTAVMFMIASIVVASKMEEFSPVWTGLGGLVASVLAIYCGPKLVGSLRTLVRNSEGVLGSQTLTDSLAAIFVLLTAAGLVSTVSELFTKGGDSIPSLIATVVCLVVAIAFAMPEIVTTKVGAKCSPAQELFSLVQFFLKVALRVIPYVWTGVIAFTGLKLLFTIGSDDIVINFMVASLFGLAVLFLPLISYLVYLLVCALIDLLQAVLAVPAKLDKIAAK